MSTQSQSRISAGKAKLLVKHDDDVVIVSAVRSALAKGRKGGFSNTRPEYILSAVLKAAYTKAGLDPSLIEDVSVGNVLPAGGGAGAARMAALHAGIPNTSAVNTVNRQCSSGLTAVSQIANQILSGSIDIGVGAGVESMTFGYGAASQPDGLSEAVLSNQEAADCLIPMGITSENVASDYSISRARQDAFAATSFQRAATAQAAGRFVAEIVPITTTIVDPRKPTNDDGSERTVQITVSADEGIRSGVTAESLAKLKPAFTKDGTTHAGNASQITDGAAAVVLARRSVAVKLGLPIVGKYVLSAVIGVPPRIMGVGPAYAIPRVLERISKIQGKGFEVGLNDIDFFEINEAFASQAIFSVDHLGIPYEKVNVHGGAIALGHPLGATGARQIVTGMNIAQQYGHKVFVTSMCIGSGMGMAAVFVSEQ